MYRVQRDEDRIIIEDWNGKVVYSVKRDAYIVYRQKRSEPDVTVAQVGSLTDQQLLAALATAVTLPFTPAA